MADRRSPVSGGGRSAIRDTRWANALLVAALLASCTPPVRQFDLLDQPLTCDEGNRLSYRTLEAMGFTVGEFQPATPTTPGVLRASRRRERDAVQSVTVHVDCRPGGVSIVASEDGKWLEQMEIKRAFQNAFINVRTMSAAQAELDAKVLAGTAPASQQRRDLKVLVQPLRGQGSKLDFPFDLQAAGILPVRIDVSNLTPRTYRLALADVRLTRADRERVAALPLTEAATRVGQARPSAGAPLTTLSPDAIADTLALRLFTATEIPPGAQRQGYLYFPLAEYVSARLVFTDTETDEEEGVRVEF